MATSPLQIFNSAHTRSLSFLTRGNGPKAKDDLRAAVFFAVAAIDAYFKVKVTDYLKRERLNNPSDFLMPQIAKKLIRDMVAREINKKDYQHLTKNQQEIVDTMCDSKSTSLISYLEDSLEHRSFQSLNDMDEALKIMGFAPAEIWGKFNSSSKSVKIKAKRGPGRPKKVKVGKKIDARTQLSKLFTKRQHIAHEADIVLRGRQKVGEQRMIKLGEVQKWLDSSKTTVNLIDRLIG